METMRPAARPKRAFAVEKGTGQKLPSIRLQPGDGPTLRYLQYLRKREDHQATAQTCLPPLTIRTVQGKYREPVGSGQGAQPALGPRARSVGGGHGARRDDAAGTPPVRAKASSDSGVYSFPRQFWEGPLFRIYQSSPKLRNSMTLRRLRALRSLLGVADFEAKTGFWEKEYDTGEDVDLLDMTSAGRKGRDGSRPPSKIGSEHSHRKSVIANRLPTIDDE